jgi:uncharacterized membrane protein
MPRRRTALIALLASALALLAAASVAQAAEP